jgi:hypothetical protein
MDTSRNEMQLLQRSLFSQWTEIFRSVDISDTSIKVNEWDSRADAFSVNILLHSRQLIERSKPESNVSKQFSKCTVRTSQ